MSVDSPEGLLTPPARAVNLSFPATRGGDAWLLSNPAKLRDRFALDLARQIVRCDAASGDLLPAEAALGREYGVSKAVVREGLQALAAMGMVSIRHGKRTVVSPADSWNVMTPLAQLAFHVEGRGQELAGYLYEVRTILETNTAELAAGRRTEAQVGSLMELVDQMRDISQGNQKVGEFLKVDAAFHDVVAAGAGNAALRSMIRDLQSAAAANWWRGTTVLTEQLPLLTQQHARIGAAIRRRDRPESHSAMLDHLQWARANDVDEPNNGAAGGEVAPISKRALG